MFRPFRRVQLGLSCSLSSPFFVFPHRKPDEGACGYRASDQNLCVGNSLIFPIVLLLKKQESILPGFSQRRSRLGVFFPSAEATFWSRGEAVANFDSGAVNFEAEKRKCREAVNKLRGNRELGRDSEELREKR